MTNDTPQKKCSYCQRLKPTSAFGSASCTTDRLQYYCKECQRAYRKSASQKKQCARCEGKLLVRHFPLSRLTADGYFDWCFSCCRTHGTPKTDAGQKGHYETYFSASSTV